MKKVTFSSADSNMLGKSLASFKNQTIQDLAQDVYGAGLSPTAQDISISIWLRFRN